jgi:hypothetical protein
MNEQLNMTRSEDEDGDESYRENVTKIITMIDVMRYNDGDESQVESEDDPEDNLEEDIFGKYGISGDESKS